ncbi:MAG: cyclic nucleotide-binding domain-containing protein, partial [Pseudomonadota bacterium]
MIPEIDFIKKIYIFQDLDQQELEFMAQIMSSCSFTAGQEVMKEGEPGDSMYVIAEGALEIHKVLTMKFGEDDFRET